MTTDSTKHWSDCAIHNEPAYPKGECDCGGYEQEQGEPVAIVCRNEYNEYRLEPHDSFDIKSIPFNVDVPLYTTPQQRKPLTDEEIDDAIWRSQKVESNYAGWVKDQRRIWARAIEAAHGIKE